MPETPIPMVERPIREVLRAEFDVPGQVKFVLDGSHGNFVILTQHEAQILARRILEVPRDAMPERFFEVMDA